MAVRASSRNTDTASRIISGYLKIINKNLPWVKAGRRLEPLHQLRVTLRRLRNSFWAFEKFLPKDQIKHWDKDLQSSSRISGEARDLDVQIMFLKDYRLGLNTPAEKKVLTQLITVMQARRSKLQKVLLLLLTQLDRKATLKEIKTFFTGKKICNDDQLGALAAKKIHKRKKELLQFNKIVEDPKKVGKGLKPFPTEFHQMRISAKHLRYTLEIFHTFLGKKTDFYIERVIALQRVLGEMHDFDVWLQILPQVFKKFSTQEKKTLEELERYCKKEREKSYQKMTRLWKKYQKQKFWDQLVRN